MGQLCLKLSDSDIQKLRDIQKSLNVPHLNDFVLFLVEKERQNQDLLSEKSCMISKLEKIIDDLQAKIQLIEVQKELLQKLVEGGSHAQVPSKQARAKNGRFSRA